MHAHNTAKVPFDVEQKLYQACQNYLLDAAAYLGKPLKPATIHLDLRGKAAGQVHPLKALIRFNPILLKDNQAHFLKHVTGHEIAHWAVFQYYGRVKPHGREWQDLMQQGLHLPANRLHDYNVTKVAGPTFRYQCQCQTHLLSIRRHRAALKGRQYQCRNCHQQLVFIPH